MKLSNIDTTRLLLDISDLKLIQIAEKLIPEFKAYSGDIPKKKLYEWVVLMFDLRSDLLKTYKNYFNRKFEAARIVGFRLDKEGKYDRKVEKFLLGQDDEINAMCMAYVAEFALPEYIELIANQIILYRETQKLIAGTAGADADKVIGRVTTKIKILTRALFHSGDVDEVMAARKALYARAGKDRDMFRPEDIAEMLSAGKDLPDDFSPYGDYKPKKMVFGGDDPVIVDRALKEGWIGNEK